MISQKLLLELKQIIEEDYKVKLTMREVLNIATTLVGFAETLMKMKNNYKYETKGGKYA